MLKDIFLFMHLKVPILVSLILISITAILCGVCVVLPKSSSYRILKIVLPESLQAVTMMPLASLYLTA